MITCGIYFKNNLIPEMYNKFLNIEKPLPIYTLKSNNSPKIIIKSTEKVIQDNELNSNLLLGTISSKEINNKATQSFKWDTFDLNNNFWGNYICFLLKDTELEVFVPQCSQLQIFYYSTKEYVIFSSHISFFKNFIDLSFNEEYFRNFLLIGDFISTYTPFKMIKECGIGYKTIFDNSLQEKSICLWNYGSHTQDVLSNKDYMKNIPETFAFTNKTIIENHKNIFLELSGGLDSSSILFTLNEQKNLHQKIFGINLADETVQSSNEIEHVKALNKVIDFELIQIDYNECLPFTPVEKPSILPNKPTILMSHLKYYQILDKIASSYTDNPCFINGHGGDSLFLSSPPLKCIADLAYDKKYGQISNKIKELSLYYRRTLLEIFSTNITSLIKYKLGIHSSLKYNGNASWLLLSQKLNKNYFTIFKQLGFVSAPSKDDHCFNIYLTLASMQTNLRSNKYYPYYPFATQPMLETALKIKSYDSFNAEYDRLLFRKSISNFYSTDLVWRKDKGSTTGVFHKGLNSNRNYLLSLCMDGYLAQSGIINRNKLLEHYERTSKGIISQQWLLVHLLCLEMYIDGWKEYV